MAVVLRLQRVGKKNEPRYRIVAIDSRRKVSGKPIEVIGSYDAKTKKIELKLELYQKWLNYGAKPTPTVASLYKKFVKKQKIESEIIQAITSNQ